MNYNYHEAVYEDVLEYIRDEINFADYDSLGELEERLNDELWTVDSVTGNGSGSYWFSSYKAEEALIHNLDLLAEAVEEFGGNTDVMKDGAEACDVTIRCYLLPQAIAQAIEEIKEEFEEAHANDEED